MAEELYNDGKWRVVRDSAPLPDGRTKTAIRAGHCDTAHILAVTNAKKILVLREYRPFDGTWVWMLPSGHVDKEKDPLVAAKRELREETGYEARKIRHYCTAKHSESLLSENHFYLAEDLVKNPLPQDEDELIEVHECALDDAIEKVLNSPFVRIPSAFVLLKYAREFAN